MEKYDLKPVVGKNPAPIKSNKISLILISW